MVWWSSQRRTRNSQCVQSFVQTGTRLPLVTTVSAALRACMFSPTALADIEPLAVNGNTKVTGLRNRGADDVQRAVQRLRDDGGRKVQKHHVPVRSSVPSIQGVWDPTTRFDSEFDVRVP